MMPSMARCIAIAALISGASGVLRHRNAPAKSPGPIAVRSLVGHNSTTNGTMTHQPLPTDSLKEWKTEATGCLTFCGSLKQNCFRGCLDDCINVLQAPRCPALVLDKACSGPCKDLEASFKCLQTVKAGATQECHSKLNVGLKGDCKY